MVSKWVISPPYKWGKHWGYNPLIHSPLILTSWDIQVCGIFPKNLQFSPVFLESSFPRSKSRIRFAFMQWCFTKPPPYIRVVDLARFIKPPNPGNSPIFRSICGVACFRTCFLGTNLQPCTTTGRIELSEAVHQLSNFHFRGSFRNPNHRAPNQQLTIS